MQQPQLLRHPSQLRFLGYGHPSPAKLDALIITSKHSESRFIGIDWPDEAELRELRKLIDEKCPGNEDCVEEIADEMAETGLLAARTH